MPYDGADEPEGDDPHDDQRLQVGSGGDSQQGVNAEDRQAEAHHEADTEFSLLVRHAGDAIAQPGVFLQ